MPTDWIPLQNAAVAARARAWAPYSRFRVGVAALTRDGRIFAGANYESASYGLTLCAERAALLAAQQAGVGDQVVAVALSAARLGAEHEEALPEPVTPCGACRQWLFEAAARAGEAIALQCGNSDFSAIIETDSTRLLPHGFSGDALPPDARSSPA